VRVGLRAEENGQRGPLRRRPHEGRELGDEAFGVRGGLHCLGAREEVHRGGGPGVAAVALGGEQHALEGGVEVPQAEGLGEVVPRPGGERGDRGVDRPEPGHHQGRHRRVARGGPAHDLDPVDPGQLQVRQDDVGRLPLEEHLRGFAVGHGVHDQPSAAEVLREQLADRGLVVDHQHADRHLDLSVRWYRARGGARMARIEKADRGLSVELDEVEQKMFVLKIDYEKYFSGLERIEPLRARDEVRRLMRDFQDEPITNSVQRFRYQTLKARFQSQELYWQRNLVLMERGTHPKMRFRADAKAKAVPSELIPDLPAEQIEVLRQRHEAQEREERAYKLVFDRYLEARTKCGQGTDNISFDAVREALKKQVRQIKSTYQCEGVKFRVVVEDGKAKVKALPQGTG
jgi:hypothetical protein